MTSIKQEVYEVRYVRSSEEICHILKACHVDLTSGHMGVEHTSHRVLERFVLERCDKGYRKYGNITHFSLHLYVSYTDLYL